MDVANLISRAAFTAEECDTGTSGLCAMFALALHRVASKNDLAPVLVMASPRRNGNPVRAADATLHWHHAAVRIGDRYFDIEGEQQAEWMIDNYIWGHINIDGGMMVELSALEFIKEIRSTPNALCWEFYKRILDRLNNSLDAVR